MAFGLNRILCKMIPQWTGGRFGVRGDKWGCSCLAAKYKVWVTSQLSHSRQAELVISLSPLSGHVIWLYKIRFTHCWAQFPDQHKCWIVWTHFHTEIDRAPSPRNWSNHSEQQFFSVANVNHLLFVPSSLQGGNPWSNWKRKHTFVRRSIIRSSTIFNFLNAVLPGPIILFFLDGSQYLIVPEASLRQSIPTSRSR